MKNPSRPLGSYYSTSQVAQILGLSVGTIKRMVESGALHAYTTQGGHRRILTSSVQHYCRQHGMPCGPLLPDHAGVCVVHPANIPLEPQETWAHLPHVHPVSHPLALAGMGEECVVFFIDARVAWLDWPDWQRPSFLPAQARFIVYHSEALTPEQQATVAQQAHLEPGDISADLVKGYVLALAGQAGFVPHPGPEPGSTSLQAPPAPPLAALRCL